MTKFEMRMRRNETAINWTSGQDSDFAIRFSDQIFLKHGNSTEMDDRVRVQFPVPDTHFGM